LNNKLEPAIFSYRILAKNNIHVHNKIKYSTKNNNVSDVNIYG